MSPQSLDRVEVAAHGRVKQKFNVQLRGERRSIFRVMHVKVVEENVRLSTLVMVTHVAQKSSEVILFY
jgi:hypothetical protein